MECYFWPLDLFAYVHPETEKAVFMVLTIPALPGQPT